MTQNLTPAERVGKNLKNLIKQSKYKTQDKFSEAMWVDPATVRRWIAHGIKDINLIFDIAKMFDVDFQELLK